MTTKRKHQATEFSISRFLFEFLPFGFLLVLHFLRCLLRLFIIEGMDSKMELVKLLLIMVSLTIFCLLELKWQERLKTVLTLAIYLISSIMEAERIHEGLVRGEKNSIGCLVFSLVLMQALLLFKEIMIQALSVSFSLIYFILKNVDLTEQNSVHLAEILLLILFALVLNIHRETQMNSSLLHRFLEKNFFAPIVIIATNNNPNNENVLFANTFAKSSCLFQTRKGSALQFCKGLKFKLLDRKISKESSKKYLDLQGLVSEVQSIKINEPNKKVFRVYHSGLTQRKSGLIFGDDISETNLSTDCERSNQHVSNHVTVKGSYLVTASKLDLGGSANDSIMLLFEEIQKEIADVQLKNTLMTSACKKLDSLMSLIFCTIEQLKNSSLGESLQQESIKICEKLTKILYFKFRNMIDIGSYNQKIRKPTQRVHKLGPMLKEVFKIMKLPSKTKGISIINDYEKCTNIDVVCDSEIVIRILIELIENAIKHTKYGGNILIKAKLKRPNKKLHKFNRKVNHLHLTWYIQITVEDNGYGIQEEYMGGLFKLNSRRNSDLQNFESSKTGLPLCHKLLKIMLKPEERRFPLFSVRSVLNIGSAFSFMLPTTKSFEPIIL